MHFANPIFLWALSGLSIPIAIHLLSKKEGKIIRLGSIRHVQETSTQQFKGIRLNELFLLLVRCLLIVIFSLILSGLNWNNGSKARWLIIEKELAKQPQLKTVMDSLISYGYEARLLANDFPRLEDSTGFNGVVNYWLAIEQLQAKNLSDVIVFSESRIENFKGMRLPLPSTIKWISYPRERTEYTLQAIQMAPDSIVVRKGHTRPEETFFVNTVGARISEEVAPVKTYRINLVSDEKYNYDQRMVRAALLAINKTLPVKLEIIQFESSAFPPGEPGDWCIWLSDRDLPKMPMTQVIFLKPQDRPQDLIIPQINNRWMISKRLNEEVALRENMTLQLASVIIPRNTLEALAGSKDRRMVSDSLAWGSSRKNPETTIGTMPNSANPYLIVLLLFLFLFERLISYKRNQ